MRLNLEYCVQFWTSKTETWSSWSKSSEGQQRWWGDWSISFMRKCRESSALKEECQEDGPGSAHWCQAIGQEAAGRTWCTGSSTGICGRSSSLCVWLWIGTGYPERLGKLLQWKYPGTIWMQSCTVCARKILLEQGWDEPTTNPSQH